MKALQQRLQQQAWPLPGLEQPWRGLLPQRVSFLPPVLPRPFQSALALPWQVFLQLAWQPVWPPLSRQAWRLRVLQLPWRVLLQPVFWRQVLQGLLRRAWQRVSLVPWQELWRAWSPVLLALWQELLPQASWLAWPEPWQGLWRATCWQQAFWQRVSPVPFPLFWRVPCWRRFSPAFLPVRAPSSWSCSCQPWKPLPSPLACETPSISRSDFPDNLAASYRQEKASPFLHGLVTGTRCCRSTAPAMA